MLTSTATVVENKLAPVAQVQPARVPVITVQGIAPDFDTFASVADLAAGQRCRAIVHAVSVSITAPVEDIKVALAGVVESTRSTVDGKRKDGERTAMARKFQSYVRSIWGAVKFGRMTIEQVQGYVNNQRLYDDSVKALAGDDHNPALLWHGETVAQHQKQQDNAKLLRNMREAAGVDSVAELAAELMDVDEARKLRDAAAKLAQDKAVKAKLAKLEERAKKVAAKAIEEFGAAGAIRFAELVTAEIDAAILAAGAIEQAAQ